MGGFVGETWDRDIVDVELEDLVESVVYMMKAVRVGKVFEESPQQT